jgi:hypothetical protein
MEDWAGWVAPISTTLAACMTAANLGPRVTGWGFVVFTVGSIAWALVGLGTGQANLVWQNAVLTGINLIGVWRWLGREARYAEGGAHAAEASRAAPTPTLFPVSRFSGGAIVGPGGDQLAQAVDAMAECGSGRIAYVVAREGGIGGVGERLHAIPFDRVRPDDAGLSTTLTATALRGLAEVDPAHWPRRVPAA